MPRASVSLLGLWVWWLYGETWCLCCPSCTTFGAGDEAKLEYSIHERERSVLAWGLLS